jgi:hypothetical protein
MIQRLIHRQFPQHHHLRNPQCGFAVGGFQDGGYNEPVTSRSRRYLGLEANQDIYRPIA